MSFPSSAPDHPAGAPSVCPVGRVSCLAGLASPNPSETWIPWGAPLPPCFPGEPGFRGATDVCLFLQGPQKTSQILKTLDEVNCVSEMV